MVPSFRSPLRRTGTGTVRGEWSDTRTRFRDADMTSPSYLDRSPVFTERRPWTGTRIRPESGDWDVTTDGTNHSSRDIPTDHRNSDPTPDGTLT